jgi:acyl dehydratase
MDGPINEMSSEELTTRVGTSLGTSDWFHIDQKTIDSFADVTHDHYFIHIDPKRAAAETPFGGTIAHGFLTMSMLAPMAYQACPVVKGSKTNVNYGFNRLRFVAPVRTGSRIRGHFVLKSFDVRPSGRWQAIYDVKVEIEGEPRPALTAEWIAAGFL